MTHSFSWFLQTPSPALWGLILRSYMGFWKFARPNATPNAGGLHVSTFVHVFWRPVLKFESHSEGAGESPYLKISWLGSPY